MVTGDNNQLVAKNTIVLFVRMLFTVLISLYSSRIVLHALGEENYGVYNVVGGIVMMCSIVTTALSTSISRFLSFEIGKGNTNRIIKVFSTSVIIQILINLMVIILVETLGLWFLNTKMTIPPGGIVSANCVLQCSLLAFIFSMLSVPFSSFLIAHEKMSIYAYMGIFEVAAKLVVALITEEIPQSYNNKLIFYAIGITIISLLVFGANLIYCKIHFKEQISLTRPNLELFYSMTKFAGWSFMGSTALMLNTQGVNMMFNVVYGPIVNAARGLATTVNNTVWGFVNSFTVALNPRITKEYANNYDISFLVYKGAKFSYLILLAVTLPIILETDVILDIWLIDVPQYTIDFVRLILVASMIDVLTTTLNTAQNATGSLKKTQILLSFNLLVSFLIAATLLAYGASPIVPFIINIPIAVINVICRLYVLKKHIYITYRLFLTSVVIPLIKVTTVSWLLSFTFKTLLPSSLLATIIVITFSSIATLLFSYVCGCNSNERKFVKTTLREYIHRYF